MGGRVSSVGIGALPSYLLGLLGVLLGLLGVLAGGADDSPGLQGLGALVVLAGVALAVRSARRRRSSVPPA